MTTTTWIWTLVWARALLGTLFILIALQMVLHARDELTIRVFKGQNGIEAEILKGQIRFGWLRVGSLTLLTISAWLSAPFVGRHGATYRWPQVIASAFVFVLLLIDGTSAVLKWRERDRLLRMARNYRRKTEAEGGDPA